MTEVQNVFTTPNRPISHPVNGTATPFATAKAVTIHVELSLLTPRLPAIVGSETFAIVVSSTCMNVPSASANAVSASAPPVSGAGPPVEGADISGRSREGTPSHQGHHPGGGRGPVGKRR
jgi:hypothetical protein